MLTLTCVNFDPLFLQDDDLGDLDEDEGKEQPSTTGSLGMCIHVNMIYGNHLQYLLTISEKYL